MSFDENWDITLILIKIEIIWKHGTKSRFSKTLTELDFSKILTKIETFLSFDENQDFQILAKIENFRKFWLKSRISENFD